MSNVNWLVDSKVFNNSNESVGLIRAIQDAKHPSNLFLTKHVPFDEENSFIQAAFKADGPLVVYGTINFVKRVQKEFERYMLLAGSSCRAPLAFGLTPDIDCLNYLTKLPSEYFLNADYAFMPFVRFAENGDWWYTAMHTDTLFIRPNSGGKVFTGTVIPRREFDSEINAMRQLTGVVNSTLVLIAPAQKIVSESRFIIANKQVIHGVKYVSNGMNHYDGTISGDPPHEARQLADKVAVWPWQVDHCYVCDVAILENGEAKIVEFNAFCCAGFYTTEYTHIINTINDTALLVAKDELVLER